MIIGTVGIIGGGQLGRMLIEHGFWKINASLKFLVIDPSETCSCSHLDPERVKIIKGNLYDKELLSKVAAECDVMTFEIEHFENSLDNVPCVPRMRVLDLIKHKHVQKKHLDDRGIKTVPYDVLDLSRSSFFEDERILKVSAGGYDGQGVFKLEAHTRLCRDTLIGGRKLGTLEEKGHTLFVEKFIKDKIEVSIIVAVQNGEAVCYEAVEMHFKGERNILSTLKDASRNGLLSDSLLEDMQRIAVKAALTFESNGLFAVEMFYDLKTKERFVNEIAPRVHNSGHHTIDSHDISQFEMMARLVLGLKIAQPKKLREYEMQNLLGPADIDYKPYKMHNLCGVFPETTRFYDYGKDVSKPWRKLGHITCLDGENSPIWENWTQIWPADIECAKVGVIMGSVSDHSIMQAAVSTLRDLQITFECTVVSAHRTPDRLTRYAVTAKERGLKVIIAGAGGSAHLPSMIAANTSIPVIGVPIFKEGKPHGGQDALLSIVQMPPGVPVACMAVNGAKNAALFAASIIAPEELEKYREGLTKDTEATVKIN